MPMRLSSVLRVHALCLLLALAGCTTVPAPRPEPAERGRGGWVVDLPGPQQRLQTLARQEWILWGRATLDAATETMTTVSDGPRQEEHLPDFSTRVLLYWFFLKGSDFPAEGALHPDGSLQAWSAVFISYLMQAAGIPRDVFPPSIRHWDYIKRIHDWPNPLGFEARDAAIEAPRIGDLICAPRAWTAEIVTRFEHLASIDSAGTYHCDLVVSVEDGRLGAIGGNVRDGVTLTHVRLDAAGRVQPTPERPWIVVLRNNLP